MSAAATSLSTEEQIDAELDALSRHLAGLHQNLKDRPAMTERNPIYQAMLRTRMIFVMMREFEKAPHTKALFDQHRNEMGVLRALSERGVIPVSVDREIRLGAARSIHAAAINHWRKQSRLIDRRRMPRMLRDAETHRVRF
jgi:hypothetical protein